MARVPERKGPWWLPYGAVPELSAAELYGQVSVGDRLQIVDVRTPHEFRNGHIAGAVNVPIQSLPRNLAGLRLDKSLPVITICKTAHRSIPATRLLRRQGFDAKQLAKGMDEWRRQELPMQR